jgi:hypothetical protein
MLTSINTKTSNLIDYFTPDYSKGVSLLNGSSISYIVPSNGVIIVNASSNHRYIKIEVNGNEVVLNDIDNNYWSVDTFEIKVKKDDEVKITLQREIENQKALFYPYRRQ